MKDFKIKQLTKGTKTIILITDKGIMLDGDTPSLLSLYAMITKELLDCKGMTKDLLDKAYSIGFKSDEEIKKEAEDEVNNLLKNLSEILD